MFICLEGTDAAGKSTQAAMLTKRLNDNSIPSILVDEFSVSPIGDLIRDILVTDRFIRFHRRYPTRITESLLVLSDFCLKTEEIIIPALKQGLTVISDRYIASQIAYHAQFISEAYSLDLEQFLGKWRQTIYSLFPQEPDFTVLLDISTAESFKRVICRENHKMTPEELLIIQNSINIYKWLAKESPDKYVILNAEQPVDSLSDQIYSVIIRRLNSSC